MLGRKERDQLELYMVGSLRQLVPDDQVLVRVDWVLDLGWLRDEVAELYKDDGRPGINPEVAVRLMLAGFLLGPTKRQSSGLSAPSSSNRTTNGPSKELAT